MRDRLAALHTTPRDAPPRDGAEQRMLDDLLQRVRAEAERELDESRPQTAASAVGLE